MGIKVLFPQPPSLSNMGFPAMPFAWRVDRIAHTRLRMDPMHQFHGLGTHPAGKTVSGIGAGFVVPYK